MKKFILLISFTLVTQILLAQSPRFGLMFTPSLSWTKADNPDISSTVRAGIDYGAIAEFYFTENYAFTTEVYHSITGVTVDHDKKSFDFFNSIELPETGDTTGVSYPVGFKDYQVDLQYIEFPLGLKLQTNEIGYLKYFGHIGVRPAFLVRARLDATSTTDNNDDFENKDVQEDVESFDFALRIGAGAQYSLTESVSLVAALYFNNGFVDTIPDGDGEKLFRKGLSLRVGVMF